MISEKKLQANRLNAQKSTGPKSEEGKAAVSLNALTHGLRARHAVMLIEKPAEFHQLCHDLWDEYQPASPTEVHLVEQMAVNHWKLGRMEALVSNSNLQSCHMHLAFKDPTQYTTRPGYLQMPDLTRDRFELKTLQTLGSIQRHQGQIERSYYRALETLERVQEKRKAHEKEGQKPALPAKPAEPEADEVKQAAEVTKLKVMTAGAGGPGWDLAIQPGKPSAKRRRFGNTWLHKSGLPEGLEVDS